MTFTSWAGATSITLASALMYSVLTISVNEAISWFLIAIAMCSVAAGVAVGVGAGVAAGVGAGVGTHVTCSAGPNWLMEGGAMLIFAALASSTIAVATFCMNAAPAFTAFWTAAISTLAAAVDASAMGVTVKMSCTPDPDCTMTRSAI